tara:strand:+ start:3487 stop:3651 length:165 start_codon:yes stop_codon:yes gene_type:complete
MKNTNSMIQRIHIVQNKTIDRINMRILFATIIRGRVRLSEILHEAEYVKKFKLT